MREEAVACKWMGKGADEGLKNDVRDSHRFEQVFAAINYELAEARVVRTGKGESFHLTHASIAQKERRQVHLRKTQVRIVRISEA